MEFFIALGIFFTLSIVEFLICGVILFAIDDSNHIAEVLMLGLVAALIIINFTTSVFVTKFYHDPTSYGYQKIVVEQRSVETE